jgi:hypothetical protein
MGFDQGKPPFPNKKTSFILFTCGIIDLDDLRLEDPLNIMLKGWIKIFKVFQAFKAIISPWRRPIG